MKAGLARRWARLRARLPPPARLVSRLRDLWQLHGLGSRVRAVRRQELGAGLAWDLVVFCANYPDRAGQRNGGEFVRTRVDAYARRGLAVLVVEVTPLNRRVEFEQQDNHACLRIAPLALPTLLDELDGHCHAVAVHAVTPVLARELARRLPPERVVYFFHGAEIRDYRRLYFNYDTAEMEGKRRSRDATHHARMAVARMLADESRSALVFVSEYLRGIAARDCGRDLQRAEIIPNFIDDEFFVARAKRAEDARRVLLIRAFDGVNYAADIAVGAILALLSRPEAAALEFTVCGFGRQFRPLTAPLLGQRRVTLREGHLSREEIRALHAGHGLFLAPSRHDTQGVSMCEAMASGLVPVTHAVGGIPEYVTADCGEFAQDHSVEAYARAILRASSDTASFLSRSAAAAARVRTLCAAPATIERELALFARCAAPNARPTAPVLVSSADIGELAARDDARVRCLRRTDAALRLDGDARSVPLPHDVPCRLAYTEPREARAWLGVARALGERLAPGSLVALRADDGLLPLALILKKHFDIDYLVWDLTPTVVSGARGCALLANARGAVLAPGCEAQDIAAKFVGPLRLFARDARVADLLERPTAAPPVERAVPAAARPRRVLLVAYYAGPCRTVGVARPNYWFEELDRLSDGRTETHLVTAMPPARPDARIHHVPDYHGIALTERADLRSAWVGAFVATEAERSRQVNTLGYFWRIALERYFAARDLAFDTVIISGNPFAYFDFAAFAHARWGARVLLDYRDPFALNPVMNYDAAARATATYLEAGYNFQADVVLAVNEDCERRIVGHGEVRTAVVANGYDERVVPAVQPVAHAPGYVHFVHAGALNQYRRLDSLLAALDPARHRLHHVGAPPALGGVDAAALVLHGPQPYRDTLGLIAGADCGIVFLSESGFESTTKVYDYLCFDLDVLVVSPDPTPRGALAELGAQGGKLHWVRNTPEDLARFVANYRPAPRRPEASERYSRAASTRRLLELLGASNVYDGT